MPRKLHRSIWLLILLALHLLLACTPSAEAPPTLTVYGWEDELTLSTMADFSADTGISIEIVNYTSTEDRANQCSNRMVF